jgi:hypothetical protein
MFAVVSVVVLVWRAIPRDESVVVVGDSMSVLAKDDLVRAGHDDGFDVTVDAFPGITFAARMTAVEQLSTRRSGPVVVELGTNDVLDGTPTPELDALVDQATAALVKVPCVVFVNTGVLLDADGRAAAFNAHLRETIASHHNMHLDDWDAEFRQHPDWSYDSIHLEPAFRPQYAQRVIETLRQSC